MQYKETQRNHESKKREKEFDRLKQKLGQVHTLNLHFQANSLLLPIIIVAFSCTFLCRFDVTFM